MEVRALSDSELYVMKVIWRSEEALSLQTIVDRLHQNYRKEWKSQTVSVFLGRIVNKKILRSERKGRQFYYYPLISEADYVKQETVKCVDTLGDGKADVFFAALTQARNLTETEKKEIRDLLNELG